MAGNTRTFRLGWFKTDAWWEFGSDARLSLNLGNLTNRRYWDWNAVRGVAPSARDLDLYTQPGRSLGLTLAADW